jgi:CBS domain containing-hemolysin-like protein
VIPYREIALLASGALLAAFFSGAETGAYVISRLRLRYRATERKESWAKSLEGLLDNMPIFVTAMLIWTNLAVDAVSFACTSLFARSSLPVEPEIAATIVAAPILFVFAELAPKNLFRLRAEGLMASSARALKVTVYVVYPFARALSLTGQLVRRVFNLPPPTHWASVSRRSLHAHLAAGVAQGALSAPQQTLAENILQAGSMPAMLAATPVEKTGVVRDRATAKELIEQAETMDRPRALVHSGERDHIVGVVHVVKGWGVDPVTPVSSLMSTPVWLDTGVSVLKALVAMKRSGRTVAILAAPAEKDHVSNERDESGGITQTIDWRAKGLVTVEELLKHLVAARGRHGGASRSGTTSRFFTIKK